MRTITFDEMKAAIEKAINELGPNKTYREYVKASYELGLRYSKCYYTITTEEGKPKHCLIGQALLNLGLKLPPEEYCDSSPITTTVHNAQRIGSLIDSGFFDDIIFDAEAKVLATMTQYYQDNGNTFKDSLACALVHMNKINGTSRQN